MRSSLAAASLIIVAACGGGGDAAAPSPAFPDVSGVYYVSGGFDGTPASEASFTGTLTLTQASRESGTLGGTFVVTAIINGQVLAETPTLAEAAVTQNGAVTFKVAEGGITWTFTGTLAGKVISGRHTFIDGSTTHSGNWTTGGPPPTTGTLQVTTTTTGSPVDPDGYEVSVDGSPVGTLDANAGGAITGVSPGSYFVGLNGVAANCQVQGPNPRSVSVTAGGITVAAFTITCQTPTARLERYAGDGQTAKVGTQLANPLGVRVLDGAGDPMPDVTVTWTVRSGGGSVRPASSIPDEEGKAFTLWTLGPTSGTNTVEASAGGATITFTAEATDQ
jgi:hypothetical protein